MTTNNIERRPLNVTPKRSIKIFRLLSFTGQKHLIFKINAIIFFPLLYVCFRIEKHYFTN